jgi:hypothetical protein
MLGVVRDTPHTRATVALFCMFGMVGRMFHSAKQGQTWPRVGVKRKLQNS